MLAGEECFADVVWLVLDWEGDDDGVDVGAGQEVV